MSRRSAVVAFILIEALCLGLFICLLVAGRTALSLAALLLPFQLLAWFVLCRKVSYLLRYFAALLPLASLEMMPGFYQLPVYYAGTAVLLLLGSRLSDPAAVILPSVRKSWFAVPVLVVLTAASAAAVHGWAGPGLIRGTTRVLVMLLYAWFYAALPQNEEDVRQIVTAVILGTVASCILLPLLPGAAGRTPLMGAKALHSPFALVNLNAFATVVAGVAALSLGLMSSSGEKSHRGALGAALLVMVLALVYTQSRGAWAGFGVAFLYVAWRSKSRWLLLAGLLGLFAVLGFGSLRLLVMRRFTQTSTRDPSLWGRLVLWKYALDVFRKNWLLGVGMENFRLVKQFYGFPWPSKYGVSYNAHSLYLEFLADLGVPGFLAFMSLFLRSLIGLYRAAQRVSDGMRGLALGLFAALLAQMVHGLFDALTWQHGALTFLGVSVGLGLALARVSYSPGTASGTPGGGTSS